MSCSTGPLVCEIFSIGDAAFLEQVINAIAMITGSGDFNDLIKVAALLGIVFVFLQAVAKGAQNIEFQSPLIGVIVFMLFFGNTMTVRIVDVYTGQERPVDNVPIGVGFVGGVVSNIGYGITNLFEQAFAPVIVPEFQSITTDGFADPLRILSLVRKNFLYTSSLGKANNVDGVVGADYDHSWLNYLVECTLPGIELGLKDETALRNAPNFMENLRFDSVVYRTEIYTGGAPKNLTCTEAWPEIRNFTITQVYPQLNNIIANKLSYVNPADAEAALGRALNSMMGAAAITAQQYTLTSTLIPIYEHAVEKRYFDRMEGQAALMVGQAIQQRNVQWAAQGSLFLNTVRPVMTFFEGFVYAITPMMGFLIVMGSVAMRFASKYILTLFWIQTWLPVLAIINLYIIMVAAGKLNYMNASYNAGSLNYMYDLDFQLQTWLATGGLLASMVPAITLMLVYGGSYVATNLSGRLTGADHVNEKLMSPDLSEINSLHTAKGLSTTDPIIGTTQAGWEGHLPVAQFANNMTTSASRNLQKATTAQQSYNETLSHAGGEAYQKVAGSKDQISQLESIGHGSGEASVFAMDKAKQFAEKYGDNKTNVNALAGAITLGMSGIAKGEMGTDGIAGLIKKVMPSFGKASVGAGVSADGKVSSESRQQNSNSSDSADAWLKNNVFSDKAMTEYHDKLQEDFGKGSSNGFSEALDEKTSQALTKQANLVNSYQKSYANALSVGSKISMASNSDFGLMAAELAHPKTEGQIKAAEALKTVWDEHSGNLHEDYVKNVEALTPYSSDNNKDINNVVAQMMTLSQDPELADDVAGVINMMGGYLTPTKGNIANVGRDVKENIKTDLRNNTDAELPQTPSPTEQEELQTAVEGATSGISEKGFVDGSTTQEVQQGQKAINSQLPQTADQSRNLHTLDHEGDNVGLVMERDQQLSVDNKAQALGLRSKMMNTTYEPPGDGFPLLPQAELAKEMVTAGYDKFMSQETRDKLMQGDVQGAFNFSEVMEPFQDGAKQAAQAIGLSEPNAAYYANKMASPFEIRDTYDPAKQEQSRQLKEAVYSQYGDPNNLDPDSKAWADKSMELMDNAAFHYKEGPALLIDLARHDKLLWSNKE